MATGESQTYDLPYPLSDDPVNVHGDLRQLVEKLEAVLPLASYSQIRVLNSSGQNISAGDPVYVTGFSTKTTVAKSLGNTLATFPVIGLATTSIANGSDGVVIVSGVFSDINTSSYTAGNILYVATAGGLTTTQPTTGSGAVGVVLKANATTGVILVLGSKGNGTWGAVKAGL